VRTLNDLGPQTEAPLEVCVWTNEEGSRFVPVMMGSGVWAGAFTLDHALAARDRDGISVGNALASIGFAGSSPADVAGGAPVFGAYFEAHIEQGPVLEDADVEDRLRYDILRARLHLHCENPISVDQHFRQAGAR